MKVTTTYTIHIQTYLLMYDRSVGFESFMRLQYAAASLVYLHNKCYYKHTTKKKTLYTIEHTHTHSLTVPIDLSTKQQKKVHKLNPKALVK